MGNAGRWVVRGRRSLWGRANGSSAVGSGWGWRGGGVGARLGNGLMLTSGLRLPSGRPVVGLSVLRLLTQAQAKPEAEKAKVVAETKARWAAAKAKVTLAGPPHAATL